MGTFQAHPSHESQIIYRSAGQRITLEVQRGAERLTVEAAVLERPKDPDRLLAMASGRRNLVPQLGILAMDLDDRVAPLLPTLRRLSGVVAAGVISQLISPEEGLHTGDVIYSVNGFPSGSLDELKAAMQRIRHGQAVAVHLERMGQLIYVVMNAD